MTLGKEGRHTRITSPGCTDFTECLQGQENERGKKRVKREGKIKKMEVIRIKREGKSTIFEEKRKKVIKIEKGKKNRKEKRDRRKK